MQLPVPFPIKPMLAKAAYEVPDGDWRFEPKWDGFRCIVFRDGDEVELGSRNERPLTRYFPEMLEPLKAALPERCVVDGELVVVTDDHLDFDALGQRIHPAESRVNMLAEATPAVFIAFDVLAEGDDSLLDAPFDDRRARLESIVAANDHVRVTPVTTDPDVARDWFRRVEGAGLDGLIAKQPDLPYTPDKRILVKVKHKRTADCAVAGFRWHKDGKGVGSLILGINGEGDDGEPDLRHVGVAASFTAKRRAELVAELEPYVAESFEGHPWARWMQAEAHEDGTMPGAPSRWNNQRDQSWVPLRVELVVEVGYTTMTNGRFRGTTRFVRWRPDKTPAECTYDQLDEVPPMSFAELLERP